MKVAKRSYSLIAILAAGLGMALAMATGANAAVQVKSPPNHVIALEKNATLQANGAAVMIVVDIVCPKGASPYLDAEVTEAIGSTLAYGSINRSYTGCTGRPQAVSFGLAAAANTRPFVAGPAWGHVHMGWYYNNTSRDGWDDHTITIK